MTQGPRKPSSTPGRSQIDWRSRAKILDAHPFEGCSSCPIEGFAGRHCGFTLTTSTAAYCAAGHQQLVWLPIRQQLRSIPWRS
jgi:hypothetical protein